VNRIAAAAAAVMVTAALSATAHADETIRDEAHYFELTVPTGFAATTPADGAETILLARTHAASGEAMAVTHVAYPNPKRKDKAYRDQVVAGIAAATRDFRQLERSDRVLATVPVTDVVFRHRTGDEARVTSVRFLFFRTFTVMLTATGPGPSYRRAKRTRAALISSFQPYYARD
jgi:hypothetical protein